MTFRAILSVLVAAAAAAQNPPAGFQYQTLSDGQLALAGAMAFVADGRLLLTERVTGVIRVFENGALRPAPWATVPSVGTVTNEAGLLGIAVDPDFLRNGYVYVFFTSQTPVQCAVGRFQEVAGAGQNFTVLTPPGSIPGDNTHNSGRMVFGQDGMLYVGTGDRQVSSLAPDPSSWNGKVLRFQPPNLAIPGDNPFPGSPVWSLGHRNHFGLTVHPDNGGLYQTENGWSTADEVNKIRRGADYGWPTHEGPEAVPDPNAEDPLASWSPVVAPVGTCFSSATWPTAHRQRWFVARYVDGRIDQLTLDATGDRVLARTTFDDLPGSAFDLKLGPDGSLWVLHDDVRGARGGDELGRYVDRGASTPAVQMMSVSNKAVGGSVTWGFTSRNGDFVVGWLGNSRFAAAVSTPYGDQWVPVEGILPILAVMADDRVYLGTSVANVPQFIGMTVHCQAVRITPSLQVSLSLPTRLTLR